ncbi:MAG: hypothetical protein WB764_06370 [Xanthobacteraceae bacterium]
MAPCFAAAGEQQDEAFRQLALALEHDTRAGLRNIGDRAGARRRRAVKQNAGIVMEIPARFSAQFGLVAELTDNDHRKLRAAKHTCIATCDYRNFALRRRKFIGAPGSNLDPCHGQPDAEAAAGGADNQPARRFIKFSTEAACQVMPGRGYRILDMKPGTFE